MLACAQLCPTLYDPMDCSLQCSFVHGIFQARILKWVAISSSEGSFQARNWTHINLCILHFRRILYPLSHQKEQPYDPVIPLLGIYPEKKKNTIWKDICTLIIIVALFTTARTWKKPKCPSTEEWIKTMQYIYTMQYSSAIKQWNIAHCHNILIDVPRDYNTKWNKTDRKKQILYDITQVESNFF